MTRHVLVFICLLPTVFGPADSLTGAQQATKTARIGLLGNSQSANPGYREVFRWGLRELGYVDGKNILLEYRWAEGKFDRLPALAAELVGLKVDVIVTAGGQITRSAKGATNTIPIVMAQDPDPIGSGFVASLARPGGNITGLSTLAPEISGKRLELLKEVVPKLSQVAVLWDPTTPGSAVSLKETEASARSLGVQLQSLKVTKPGDFDGAFQAVTAGRTGALMNLGSPLTNRNRGKIVDFAVKSKLPAIYNRREFVEEGGLMSYDASQIDRDRRAAIFVDKILKGAKPADLPVEQPTKF